VYKEYLLTTIIHVSNIVLLKILCIKMKKIAFLENSVQEYEWGSYTGIPELLGKQPDFRKPYAELWMGAHPKSPSMVKREGRLVPLPDLIAHSPSDVLGQSVAVKFDNQLPYLFKVLAARKPLSIQAHPSIEQARAGFERENNLNIPLDAFNRNYKDQNHKPECLCAISSFWVLSGFRNRTDILNLMSRVCPQTLKEELASFEQQPNEQGLKKFFYTLMTLNHEQKARVVSEAVQNAQSFFHNVPEFKWMLRLHREYPSDIGILSPLMLNLICLNPGQAIFLPARELHAYLYGVGIELMANSDNVLRGGLTHKHIDVPDLLQVLNFHEQHVDILKSVDTIDCEQAYPGMAKEFVLSVISVKDKQIYTSSEKRSMEILLCTKGSGEIFVPGRRQDKLYVSQGTSVIIPASVQRYAISGCIVMYKAAVPI
jgi:mannose-6-phosphate isomerase